MDWDDFSKAFNQARQTIRIADRHVNDMAHMIAGRLRGSDVSISALTQLKKELKDFNIHTGKWKK